MEVAEGEAELAQRVRRVRPVQRVRRVRRETRDRRASRVPSPQARVRVVRLVRMAARVLWEALVLMEARVRLVRPAQSVQLVPRVRLGRERLCPLPR